MKYQSQCTCCLPTKSCTPMFPSVCQHAPLLCGLVKQHEFLIIASESYHITAVRRPAWTADPLRSRYLLGGARFQIQQHDLLRAWIIDTRDNAEHERVAIF